MAPAGTGKRVLVIDDDEPILEAIGLALADEGYEVDTAPHGAAALEIAGRRPPHLILLDMRMPVMDGWQFVRAYRQRPGPHAPIVVVTAGTDADARAAAIGAQGALGKPFDLGALLAVVEHHTR